MANPVIQSLLEKAENVRELREVGGGGGRMPPP